MMIRNLLLVASLACLWGCGDRDSNPIGLELVDRMQGALVSLPPLPAADTWSRFDGLFPGPGGLEPGLVVGRMSGLILRAAVRFRVPLDSLAAAAGGSGAPDLVLTDVRLHLRRLSAFERLSGSFSVERPDFAWDEGSTFIDTVNSVELDAPSTPIPGVDLVVGADSLYTFVLPTDYVQANLDSVAAVATGLR